MQGAFPPLPEREPLAGPTKTSGTATLSLTTGVLSFVCLWGLGGVLAIVIGWLAHGEIERAEGRVGGKGLANAGIGLGIANVVVTLVALGALVAFAVRPEAAVALSPPLPPPAAAPLAPTAPKAAPPAAEDFAETPLEPLPALPPHVGAIAIVEAASGGESLKKLLAAQLRESAQAGGRVVLWTVTGECEPCAAVGRALPDARMQRALAGVRLVRADAANLGADLQRLGVPIDTVPGFTLLDAQGRPLDHIHGGEWGDDIPANIAPILDKFVRRTLAVRRYRWTRPLREGETPL
jgi:Domain of unknown function (DUF4190)